MVHCRRCRYDVRRVKTPNLKHGGTETRRRKSGEIQLMKQKLFSIDVRNEFSSEFSSPCLCVSVFKRFLAYRRFPSLSGA